MTTLTLQTGTPRYDGLELSDMLPSERRAIQTAETLINRINDYRKSTGTEAKATKLTGTVLGLFSGTAGSALTIGQGSQWSYEPTSLLEELAITILAGAAGYAIGCAIRHFNYSNRQLSEMEKELTRLEESPAYQQAIRQMSK